MKNFLQVKSLILFLFFIINYAQAQKIVLSSGSKLVLHKNVALVVKNGDIINNGSVISGNESAVYFNGTDTFRLRGSAPIDINDLFVNNSASLPLNITTPVAVKGVLALANGTSKIKTNDLLTLRSGAVKTARVASIPVGADINGKVFVERYVEAQRAWRLISSPLNSTGSPTIKASWQENAAAFSENPNPGYGTHITGTTSPANGFDYNSSRSPSCKEFVGGSWVGVANTDVHKLTDQPGYMIFVRGSRANQLNLGVAAAADNTVLRAFGNLNIGDMSYNVSATGFTLIGNPYASPIDFYTITKSAHVINNFYVWDPFLTGSKSVGGYVTVSYNGIDYDVTSSVQTVNQYIQSGTAFFVNTDGNTGTITIKETDKSDMTRASFPRPMNSPGKFRTELYVVNSNSTLTLYDGVLNTYSSVYSNDIDTYDALKLSNGAESIALLRNGLSLSIERRQPLDVNINDTVFYKLAAMTLKNYSLHFTAENLIYANTTGLLVDNFLHSESVINMSGTTDYSFSVTADPTSMAANRFKVVFKNTGTLPLGLMKLEAKQLNADVILNWQVSNSLEYKQYVVERSVNGYSFTAVQSMNAADFTNVSGNYQWKDLKPGVGTFYYRIKGEGVNGDIKYSSTQKISIGNTTKGISVTSSVLVDNRITLVLQQQPAGEYTVMVKNIMGQMMYIGSLYFEGGSSTKEIVMNNSLARGVYYLEIGTPDKESESIKLVK